MLEIRAKSGADSVYLLGSAKFSNEGGYLFRKFAAFWGTNSIDHQARICHSTTVAGVANTWGYGAMTNSYNDIRNSKTIVFMGSNAAEAHPVSLQHILTGKEINRANVFVLDPRFTRTAAHATEYVRFRSGTDIAVIWGMLHHIFNNGWEDKEFIAQRVYGMDQIRAEVAKWTPEEVERVTGIPGEQLKKVAETFAKQRPSTFIWCMGGTQHTVGTANVRAYCNLLLATGNVGAFGGGANIFRGHCNVQGATDIGLDITSLPLYYGLVEGAWKHWARVWEVEYDYFQSRFDEVPAKAGRPARTRKQNMELPGIPSTRWFDATLANPDDVDQRDSREGRGHHGPRRQHRSAHDRNGEGPREARIAGGRRSASDHVRRDLGAQERHLSAAGLHPVRDLGLAHGLQPFAAVGRADRQADLRIEGRLRDHLPAFARSSVSPIRCSRTSRWRTTIRRPEDLLREINRGGFSTGYSGQSPERLKAHMKNQGKFDLVTLRAKADEPEIGGDYYGLPWPCWGTPQIKHPGTHTLYNTNLHVKDGGGTFRARFGVVYEEKQPDGSVKNVNLLAEGSYSKGSELTDGYPEFTYGVLKKLGWDKDLTEAELATINKIGGNNPDGVGWAVDLSGGIIRVTLEHGVMAYGNGKARAVAWNLPDPVPVHREPIYTAASRARRQISDASGRTSVPHGQSRLLDSEGGGGQGARQAIPDHPDLGTSGRIRRRRRGNPLEPLARRIAAGHVRRGQHLGCRRARHQGRRLGLGVRSGKRLEGAGQGAGHRPCRQGRGVHAVPLRRLVPGRRSARQISEGQRSDRARRKRQHDHVATATIRSPACTRAR